jgi:hypothetical protein
VVTVDAGGTTEARAGVRAAVERSGEDAAYGCGERKSASTHVRGGKCPLNDNRDFSTSAEPFDVRALVAEIPVEALHQAVLPRLARRNLRRRDVLALQPVVHGLSDEIEFDVDSGHRADESEQARDSPGLFLQNP